MQRYKYFLASFVAIICLLGYVVLAQTKTQNPPVVSASAPFYPPVALALNLQGDFLVDVEVDRSGKVASSKAVEGTHKLMRKVIEQTADRWQFAPDENAEKKRRVQLTFTFRYMPKASGFDITPVFYPPYKIEVRSNSQLLSTPSH
jgi:TonB family protein